MRYFWSLLLSGLLLLACQSTKTAQKQQSGSDGYFQSLNMANYLNAYHDRCDSVIQYYSKSKSRSYASHAARFSSGIQVDFALKSLNNISPDRLGAGPFWNLQFAATYCAGEKYFSPALKQKLRDYWRTNTSQRGDTENHWLLYYSGLYLMAERHPGEPADQWYTGKNSAENLKEARDYLYSWIDLTTTTGQGEFDSPDYFGVYISCLSQLYAWARDPEMKIRARMMLDYLLVDFAVENLDGFYTGAHSRIYPTQVLEGWKTDAASISWLLFNNTPARYRWGTSFLAMSGYEPPEILYHIATDRSQPYVHREYKRTRHRIRNSSVKNAPVYKYTFMSDDYAIGSLQGGLLQPIQQHSWDITWAIPDPREGFNTLFTLHPYSSPFELSMYFPEEKLMLTRDVIQSKTTYDSFDKWTGGSPYEQIFQHRNALIALYHIPKDARFPHIDGFFPKTLEDCDFDSSGWIFCRDNTIFIAYYPLAKFDWLEEKNNWRLHSTELKNGAVVQVVSSKTMDSFKSFKQEVRKLFLETTLEPTPSVIFSTLDGTKMEFTYGEIPRLNGVLIDYDQWPLFESPFLTAAKNSRKLEMHYGRMHRLLDFNTLTIKDWVEKH